MSTNQNKQKRLLALAVSLAVGSGAAVIPTAAVIAPLLIPQNASAANAYCITAGNEYTKNTNYSVSCGDQAKAYGSGFSSANTAVGHAAYTHYGNNHQSALGDGAQAGGYGATAVGSYTVS